MSMSRYPLRGAGLVVSLFVLLIDAPASLAHHPGADLDKVMGSKEKFFQIIDRKSPEFALRDAAAKTVTLTGVGDKVVVLNFIYTNCPDICPLHAERIAEIQTMINQTPMKDMVRFITITTDPVNDTPDILKAYGPAHGLDPANWSFLTSTPDQSEDTTRKLAEAFGHKFIKAGGDYQVHSVVTHIIGRNGRWAANFHGLRFEPVNMVLYINGLINNANAPKYRKPPGLWDKFKKLFEPEKH
jgi:protein SCO1/2